MTKVALIPPKGWEKFLIWNSSYQMALATPPLMESMAYVECMQAAQLRGEYIIVDNGAAEGTLQMPSVVKKFATSLNGNEIILPDVLGNKDATIAAIRQYLRDHFESRRTYMAVVQGTTLEELQTFVKTMASIEAVDTLGIPRDVIRRIDMGLGFRIDFANWVRDHYHTRFAIHFLGATASWLKEVEYVSRYAPFVRSLDTSLPFNYAIAGESISNGPRGYNRKRVERRTNFFDDIPIRHEQLIIDNIRTYQSWANGG